MEGGELGEVLAAGEYYRGLRCRCWGWMEGWGLMTIDDDATVGMIL